MLVYEYLYNIRIMKSVSFKNLVLLIIVMLSVRFIVFIYLFIYQ